MRTAIIYNFLLEANLMAGAAILMMLLIRKFLRKPLGNRAIRFGWLLAAIRLLCPLTLPNPFIGQIRAAQAYDLAIRPIASQIQRRVEDGLGDLYWFVRSGLGIPEENAVARGAFRLYSGSWNGTLARWIMLLYLAGLLAVLGWFIFSNIRFRRQLIKNRVELLSGEGLSQYQALCRRRGVKPVPVYLTDPLPSACLAGVFRPWIALPLSLKKEDWMRVLDHEICHFKGRDHWWALVRMLCCIIHWFNPLVWLAAHASRMDGELCCDDRVTRDMTGEEKQRYASALVLAAARKNTPGLPVLASGMTMKGRKMKVRVQGILAGKKAVKWFAVSFMVLASMLLVCAFATAEYYSISPIPALDVGNLPAPTPVLHEADALDYAVKLAALPAFGADLKDARWQVSQGLDESDTWQVTAIRPGGEYFILEFYRDGRLYHMAQSGSFSWNSGMFAHYRGSDHPWAPGKLQRFFEEVMVAFYPQETPDWGQLKISYYQDELGVQDKVIAILEIPLENYRHMMLTVELSPTFRILDCGPGHG